ncbi:MAG: RraA family protein [Actinobacteria bacterium]|nr:RraA family protein [Actinomycetota bacterium]
MPERPFTDDHRRRFLALHSALLCDSLDRMGLPLQVMRSDIRPVYPGAVVVGRALTVLQTAVYRRPDEPYKLLFEAFRALRRHDVLVITTTGERVSGVWGGLLSTSAQAHGAMGCVMDGLTRDVMEIEQISFPVFAAGRTPIDSEGRCEAVEWNTPIECGGARVSPGDVIFGDDMGLVVIPGQAAEDVLRRAEEKQRGETNVRGVLATGADLGETFKRYGIL